jgi:uncharacterized protein YjhX (UPF0386 family)
MKKSIFFISLLIMFAPAFSYAAAYWMEVKGNGKINQPVTIQVIYGRIDEYGIRHRDTGKEFTLAGEFKMTLIDNNGQQKVLTLSPKTDCWEATFTPTNNGVYRILGLNDSHPVIDRSKTGGKNVRPIDYLCADYIVGDAKPMFKPAQMLDIVTGTTKDIITVKAFNNNGIAVAGTKLRVFNPENWEKELVLDEKGEAVFKTTMPGLYIIRQDWDDAKPGTYKGVAYTSVRHRCNYSLPVK